MRRETLELVAILDKAKRTSSQDLRYVLSASIPRSIDADRDSWIARERTDHGADASGRLRPRVRLHRALRTFRCVTLLCPH